MKDRAMINAHSPEEAVIIIIHPHSTAATTTDAIVAPCITAHVNWTNPSIRVSVIVVRIYFILENVVITFTIVLHVKKYWTQFRHP